MSGDAPITVRPRPGLALAWMGVALVSFMLVTISAREVQRSLSTVETVVLRTLLALLILLPFIVLTRVGRRSVITGQPALQLVRCTVHWIAQFSWLYALMLITLAELFAIEFTAPLWVALLAPVLLGERLTPVRATAAALGFVGVLIVARPGYQAIGAGTIAAAMASICFALSLIATKRLVRTDGALTILLYMNGLQALIGLLVAYPVGALLGQRVTVDAVLALTPVAWMWVVVVTVFGLVAHFALARAFTYADAILVAPMDFLRLPLIAIVGFVLYNEPFNPWVLTGAGVVIVANAVNMWGERRAMAVTRDPDRRA